MKAEKSHSSFVVRLSSVTKPPMPEKDYSHRDVLDKLGLKPGQAVRVVGGGDKALLARAREKVGRAPVRAGLADVVLYWPRSAAEITPTLAELRGSIVA